MYNFYEVMLQLMNSIYCYIQIATGGAFNTALHHGQVTSPVGEALSHTLIAQLRHCFACKHGKNKARRPSPLTNASKHTPHSSASNERNEPVTLPSAYPRKSPQDVHPDDAYVL